MIEQARPQRDREQRDSSAKRGYGHKWRKARDVFLQQNPLCVFHQELGQIVEASVVDHKVPHRGDRSLFWRRSNWQALCKSCHDSVKQRIEATGVVPGCDASGVPRDGSHHWNRVNP